jgi:hypothetical protein
LFGERRYRYRFAFNGKSEGLVLLGMADAGGTQDLAEYAHFKLSECRKENYSSIPAAYKPL